MELRTIAIILAICCFAIILLVGILSSLLRELYRSQKPYAPFSFSKVQLWLWTLIIVPLFVLNWGFVNPSSPTINATSLVLLSIGGATTLTSIVITNIHIMNKTASKEKQDSQGFIYDILTDDHGNFSIGRLQNFVFTLAFAVIYITMFFSNGFKLLDFQPYVYILMGVSSGTYLFGKSLGK